MPRKVPDSYQIKLYDLSTQGWRKLNSGLTVSPELLLFFSSDSFPGSQSSAEFYKPGGALEGRHGVGTHPPRPKHHPTRHPETSAP